MRDNPNNQVIWVSWLLVNPNPQLVTGEPQPTRISCPNESWSYHLINKFI